MLTPVKSKQEQKMDLHQKMVTMFQSSLLKIMTNLYYQFMLHVSDYC